MDADPIMKLMIPIVVAVSALALQKGAASGGRPPARQVLEEHEWLGQYVGEWDVTSETKTQPGAAGTRTTSTERMRSIGPLWVVGEGAPTPTPMVMHSARC